MLEVVIGAGIGVAVTLIVQKIFGFGQGRVNEVPGGSGHTSHGDNVEDPKDPNKPVDNR